MGDGENRYKVEKNLETQIRIINLRLPYLIGFVITAILLFFQFVANQTLMSFMVTSIIALVVYGLAFYADHKDLANEIYSEKLPKELINDLYELKEDNGHDKA